MLVSSVCCGTPQAPGPTPTPAPTLNPPAILYVKQEQLPTQPAVLSTFLVTDGTGRITPAANYSLLNMGGVTTSPDGRNAYVTFWRPGLVRSYAVDPASSGLIQIGEQALGDFCITGRPQANDGGVYAAEFCDTSAHSYNRFNFYPRQSKEGSLGARSGTVWCGQDVTCTVSPGAPTWVLTPSVNYGVSLSAYGEPNGTVGFHASAVLSRDAFDSRSQMTAVDGRAVVSTNGSQLWTFGFDEAAGRIAELSRSPMCLATGAQAQRRLVFAATAGRLAASDEQAICVYALDARGGLTLLASTRQAVLSTSFERVRLALHPSGEFLYSYPGVGLDVLVYRVGSQLEQVGSLSLPARPEQLWVGKAP